MKKAGRVIAEVIVNRIHKNDDTDQKMKSRIRKIHDPDCFDTGNCVKKSDYYQSIKTHFCEQPLEKAGRIIAEAIVSQIYKNDDEDPKMESKIRKIHNFDRFNHGKFR